MTIGAAMLLGLCVAVNAAGQQSAIPAQEIAAYQLTPVTFERFAHATRLMLSKTRDDARYQREPLFPRDVTVSGDAEESAAVLQKRLDADPILAGALFAADIDAREYTKFAIALIGARLAHGFMKSGALRRVPDGPTAHNVAFVAQNEAEIIALLREMGLEQ